MHDHDITVLQEDFENWNLFLFLVIGLGFATNFGLGFWSPLHDGTATKGHRRNGWAQGLSPSSWYFDCKQRSLAGYGGKLTPILEFSK